MNHWRRHRVVITFAALGTLWSASAAEARIKRIEITSREPFAAGMSFGDTGPYEKIRGRFVGEVDPQDPLNAIILNIDKAARTSRGMVEFAMTFLMLKPVDLTRGNGKLLYDINNRGNTAQALRLLNDAAPGGNDLFLQDAGNGFVFRQGYTWVDAGWEGDVLPGDNRLTIELPIATSAGRAITAPILVEFVPAFVGAISFPLSGSPAFRSYEGVSTDQAVAQAELRVRPSDSSRPGSAAIPDGVLIPRSQWSFARCARNPVTGAITSVPSTGDICLPAGFIFDAVYQLGYIAKDPLVMGLGYAATRDVASFLRTQRADDVGNLNPLADGLPSHVYAIGFSSTGMFLRDFMYQGFNETEAHRKALDAVWVLGAGAHKLYLNYAFSQPNPFSVQHRHRYVPDTLFPTTYGISRDPLTRVTDGILKRPANDPLVIHTDSATEYWQFRASLVHTDDLGRDVDIPPHVRIYYLAGEQHGPARVPTRGICNQLSNPLPRGATMRAILVALDEWASKQVTPPASRYPHGTIAIRGGTAVRWEQSTFPQLAGVSYPTVINASGARDFGPEVNGNRGIVTLNPPVPIPAGEHVLLISRVDRDGNDVAGVRKPELVVPRATYTGWNTRAEGPALGDLCDLVGSFVPFARTKAERLANSDPRPSLEERYGTHEEYVRRIALAAHDLVRDRLLLEEDAERVEQAARASDIFK